MNDSLTKIGFILLQQAMLYKSEEPSLKGKLLIHIRHTEIHETIQCSECVYLVKLNNI